MYDSQKGIGDWSMKWTRLRNRIRANPALLDPDRQLSLRQARAKWRKVGRPTVAELMGGARRKAGMSQQEWKQLTGYEDREKRRPLRMRRLAIVSIVALVLALFMVFTAPGKALAQAIYETFTTIIGNVLHISAQQDPSFATSAPEYSKSEVQTLGTLSDIAAQIEGPVFYLKGEQYVLVNRRIAELEFIDTSLETEYQYGDISIYITQRWFLKNQPEDSNIDLDGEYSPINAGDGYIFQGVYTEADHTYVGGLSMCGTSVTIGINNIDDLATAKNIVLDVSPLYK